MDPTAHSYNRIIEMPESTVVSKFVPQTALREGSYESEAKLEERFIELLTQQGYQRLVIHQEKELVSNLRQQLEKLNNLTFSDAEWERFFNEKIASANEGIVEKTRKIQEDYIQNLSRDDGSIINVKLIDKKNIHNNFLQVINQYEEKQGRHDVRYDVTILVNGLPLVHVELKRRGVKLKEAFNQINRYQRDSFWAGSGLFQYVQIFVISNGTHTKYYSNTTRLSHVQEMSSQKARNQSKKTSNSFEFTCFWADAQNRVILDLMDFGRTFFARHSLLNILTKYCIFTAENLLLVMRPYQIVATERIINKIQIATNYKKYGTIEGGGYIWHTTGSGKTLTSFKTAQLATALPYIDKVIFVVDRKDLDYQTIKEYDRFQKGAANGNRNTKILQKQLENPDARIIVTTIQKLDTFISKNKQHPVYQQHVVLIFDECHRSQFGKMHTNIIKHFTKYHIFGFTGTPIFAKNAQSGGDPNLKTTPQVFGVQLHAYTIVDAINDGNVLPFRIDYINTIRKKEEEGDKAVEAINTEEALQSPDRIHSIVQYILEHFDQKTCRNKYYNLKGQRVNGFNSLLAVSSIPMCKKYYLEFKRQLAQRRSHLVVATIFSFAANEEDPADGILTDESFDTEGLDKTSRDFLEDAVQDYNHTFKTNFDTSSSGFQDYYKDVSDRVKKRQVDILIVVNMFLTGFDATTLNTLWVDKNLKMHGLIQAFSRTNRILNSVKAYGNIVCFRNLEKETNEAIALFGDKDAQGIVLLKTFADYYHGYEENGRKVPGYAERVQELLEKYPLGQSIIGEKAKKDFIVLFGNILRLRNILRSFDQFAGNEIIQPIDFQDYTGIYNDLHEDLVIHPEKESILEDVVFEMELVKQVEVNIDYILMLVEKYHQSNCQDKTILVSIDKAIMASLQLRSKKELIDKFISTINTQTEVKRDWHTFVSEEEQKELDELITAQKLKPEPTKKLVADSFRDGELKTSGTHIDKIMPPVSRFGGGRTKKKQTIIDLLKAFFEKYLGII